MGTWARRWHLLASLPGFLCSWCQSRGIALVGVRVHGSRDVCELGGLGPRAALSNRLGALWGLEPGVREAGRGDDPEAGRAACGVLEWACGHTGCHRGSAGPSARSASQARPGRAGSWTLTCMLVPLSVSELPALGLPTVTSVARGLTQGLRLEPVLGLIEEKGKLGANTLFT